MKDVCPSDLTAAAAGGSLKEIHGEAPAGQSLYGLLFAKYPITVGRDTKMAWRMTGIGPLELEAVSAAGKHISPVWGPELHGANTWKRPGQEWGSGLLFSTPGCWTVLATRGTTVAHAMVLVG